MRPLAHCEMQRDGGCGGFDTDRHAVILDQKADLLLQITFKQVRARKRGAILAGFGDMTERQSCVDLGEAARMDGDLRIIGAVMAFYRFTAHYAGEVVFQEIGRLIVQFLYGLNCQFGIGKILWSRGSRRDTAQFIMFFK